MFDDDEWGEFELPQEVEDGILVEALIHNLPVKVVLDLFMQHVLSDPWDLDY